MTPKDKGATGDILTALEAELVALLQDIAGEQGLSDCAEAFAEKMAALVCLLPKYFDIEEASLSAQQPLSGEDASAHFQAHNEMLELCVQWHLDLMHGNNPPRSAICALAQAWLAGSFCKGEPRP